MHPNRKTILWLLFASLLNLIHISLWLNLRSPTGSTIVVQPKPQRKYSYKGHDYPELLPLPHEVQTVLVPMDETVHYPAIGAPSDAEWLALTTPGFGYIRLGPEDRTFVVSMFHELHCLRMLNLAFNGPNYTSFGHVKHCLNYLRQNILCTPNLALEPGDFETKDFDVDRTHGVHECKNWDQIYEFVASNYDSFTNRTGYTYTPKPVWTGHA